MGVQFSHEIIIFGGDCKLVYHIFHRTVNPLGPNNIPAILRRSKIWRLSILHYIPPSRHPRMSTGSTPPLPTPRQQIALGHYMTSYMTYMGSKCAFIIVMMN